MKTKSKASLTGLTIIIGIFCLLCAPACAQYNYDGFPLETIKNGTVKGDVYVSSGDNFGLNDTSWSYRNNTLVSNFSDVPKSGIKWAELKVGVWGGKETRQGFANATLSNATDPYPGGYNLGLVNLNTINPSSNVDCCGNGIYLIKYNCTNVLPLLNNSSITATINAWPDWTLLNNSTLDSRIYGAVLIVVYEDGNCYTQFWINQGLENLHKDYANHPHKDANITWFNGTAKEGCSSLTVGYLAGDYGQNDYLHFNPPYNDTSPYVSPYNNGFSNAGWNINHYSTYQLNGNDVANENNNISRYFDLHTFCITGLVNNTGDNYAIFWRGHANGTDSYITDPPWPGINPETEAYYSPFLAVLKTTNITTYDFSNYTKGVAGIDHHAYRYQVGSNPPASNNVPNIEFTPTEYNRIKADDGTFQIAVTNQYGKYAAHRFVFNVTDNASVIDAINVTWNGKGWHDAGDTSNGAYLYIWNYTANGGAGAYEELDNCSGDGTENTLTGEKTTNLSNYINNGQVIVLAEQKTAQKLFRASRLQTDYVKLLLRPNA